MDSPAVLLDHDRAREPSNGKAGEFGAENCAVIVIGEKLDDDLFLTSLMGVAQVVGYRGKGLTVTVAAASALAMSRVGVPN